MKSVKNHFIKKENGQTEGGIVFLSHVCLVNLTLEYMKRTNER